MIRAGIELGNRQPNASLNALYLMNQRSNSLRIAVPRHRLEVAAGNGVQQQTPQPVKIIHNG